MTLTIRSDCNSFKKPQPQLRSSGICTTLTGTSTTLLSILEGYEPGFKRSLDDYLDKIKALLSSFNTEAGTVNFNGLSVVLEREEADKVKAMPEFSELVSSWEKYKTERTDGALNRIADLVQKMSKKIRESYWVLLSEFEAEQKKMMSNLRSPLKYVLAFLCSYVFIGVANSFRAESNLSVDANGALSLCSSLPVSS